jgi:hypothetical protein
MKHYLALSVGFIIGLASGIILERFLVMGELICIKCGHKTLGSEDMDGCLCPYCKTPMKWQPRGCRNC